MANLLSFERRLLTCVVSLLCLLGFLVSSSALAHNRSESYSRWDFQGNEIRGEVVVPLSLAAKWANSASLPLTSLLASELRKLMHWSQGNSDCLLNDPGLLSINERSGSVSINVLFTCPQSLTTSEVLSLDYSGLIQGPQSHTHIARFYRHERLDTHLFTEPEHGWVLPPLEESEVLSGFTEYMTLGIEHVITGWDHMAFIVALMLGMLSYFSERRASVVTILKLLLLLITGFTLGHSASLVTTVYYAITVNVVLVEALIGLSIAFVSFDILSARRQQWRPLMLGIWGLLLLSVISASNLGLRGIVALFGVTCFLSSYLMLNQSYANQRRQWMMLLTLFFGVIHGFGFANSLQNQGLSQAYLLSNLLSFNLGVELGQMLIVAPCLLSMALLKRYSSSLFSNTSMLLNSVLCGVGVFWWTIRLYG